MYVYRSNLSRNGFPDLRRCFPNTVPITVQYDHEVLHDPEMDTAGYVSFDEAAILWEVALRVGGDWMEIGSHTGFSGAYLAIAAASVLMMEPRLRERRFFRRWYENMERVRQRRTTDGLPFAVIQPFAARSDEYSVCGDRDLFDGVFIDGDHNAPRPQLDAQLALARLKPRGVIAFHDFCGGPVQEAVKYLLAEDQSMRCRVYDTPQMVAVCWRGDFTPPDHEPDPAHAASFERRRKNHDFDYSVCV